MIPQFTMKTAEGGWLHVSRESWRQIVANELRAIPLGDEKLAIEKMVRVFHEELGKTWASVIKRKIADAKVASDADVYSLQQSIAKGLDDLHLCFRCPKTGRPASLAVVRRSCDEPPRMRLVTREGRQGRRVTTEFGRDDELSLIEDRHLSHGGRGRG